MRPKGTAARGQVEQKKRRVLNGDFVEVDHSNRWVEEANDCRSRPSLHACRPGRHRRYTFDIAEGELREVFARRGWRDFAPERNKRVGLGAGADDAVLSAFQGRVVLHVFPESKSMAS